MGITYKDSGVDVESGNQFVKAIKPIVKQTFSKKVLTDIGGFAALFDAKFEDMAEPVLVSSTDGVGTKLKIAQLAGIHNTIGIDAVAMCANDIVVTGAKPLFFLDYISCGKLNNEIMVDVIKGIAEGCKQAGCSLIGGETAEHPGVMDENDYDIAGFCVGVIDKSKIITGKNIKKGDILIGLKSSGIHSNGYSLVRKIFFDIKKYKFDYVFNETGNKLYEELLTPTKIYVKPILNLLKNIEVKGMVHITGGGFFENIPRILPESTAAKININSWDINPIFNIIQKEGDIEKKEMFTTFNMGIGMICIIDKLDVDNALSILMENGEKPFTIGEIIEKNDESVIFS